MPKRRKKKDFHHSWMSTRLIARDDECKKRSLTGNPADQQQKQASNPLNGSTRKAPHLKRKKHPSAMNSVSINMEIRKEEKKTE